MNKEEINGYTLSVAFARSRKDGACYNCGLSGHMYIIIFLTILVRGTVDSKEMILGKI